MGDNEQHRDYSVISPPLPLPTAANSGPPLPAADSIRQFPPIERVARGLFASGPGNPGRPRGSVNRVSRDVLAAIKQLGPQAVEKLTDACERGERWAIELIIYQLIPKQRTVPLDGAEASDIREAIVDGTVSPEEAKDAVTALRNAVELQLLTEMEQRVRALEGIAGVKSPKTIAG